MVRRAPGPGPAWACRRPGGGRGTWGPLLHLAKGIAAELQRCHPLPPTTALKGSGAGNLALHMVLAANRRAWGSVGGVPWEAWADVTVAGGMFVQHVGPQ